MEPKFILELKEKRKYVGDFYSMLRFDVRTGYKPKGFLQALEGYIKLQGSSINEEHWMFFAHEIPEGEPDWFESGIEIRIDWPAVDVDVVIPLSYEEFYPMLCEECEKYLEERPEDREREQELLGRIKIALKV